MANTAKYLQRWTEAVQPHVQEQVVAVGMLNRVGGMARLGVGQISPAASMIMGKRAKTQSGGLPDHVMAAVTATKVHLFSYKQRSKKVVPKELLQTWDRSEMQLELTAKATATRLTVTLPSEDRTIELEALKATGFNDELLKELSGVPAG